MGHSIDKIVGSAMWPGFRELGPLFRPGIMAILAIKLSLAAKCGHQADNGVWDKGLVRELRILNAQGFAFGTMYGLGHRAMGVPVKQQFFRAFELIARHLNAHGVGLGSEPKLFKHQFAFVDFGCYTGVG